MKLFTKISNTQITNRILPMTYAVIFSTVLISFFNIGNSYAQTYVQSRVGYVHQQYKPLNPEILNRDEHDYLGGYMFDFEVGKQLKRKKITFMIGARIQQIKEDVKGIYTQYQINPDADINVYRTSILFTAGLKTPIVGKLALQSQLNFGPKYTLWYQDGEFKESFWRYNLPLDIGLEHPLNDKWNLTGGASISMPIYTSRTYIFYFGIITKL
ncbi:hypothetical protein [Gelidibacter japonicus]|uniref:hypothetical protein n=1 Tax=Gelidibacter japonicus TaxID=1962232 RepID=UPI003A91010E